MRLKVETLLFECNAREIEMAACQAYQFAQSLLQQDVNDIKQPASTTEGGSNLSAENMSSNKSKKAHDAIEWLQMAIRLLERDGCMGNQHKPPSTGTEKRLRSHHVRSALSACTRTSANGLYRS
jgi:hypothetical protein